MKKNILELVLVIFLIISYYLLLPLNVKSEVYIPKGNINYIVNSLSKDYSLTKIDSFVLRFMGYPQSGVIYLEEGRNNKINFLHTLTTSKSASNIITIIPGETTYFIASIIAKTTKLNENEIRDYMEKKLPIKEGYIIADSYKIPKKIAAEKIVNLLVDKSSKKHKMLSNNILGYYNEKEWNRYLTIASIITKEAANKEEMPMISSVIQNRLKRHMRLQMDGTLNYGKYSHTKVTSNRIKEDNSAYNTYKNYGLPPHPIGSVDETAIRAAIYPDQNAYLYFVRVKDKHIFSKSYKEHKRNIRISNRSK